MKHITVILIVFALSGVTAQEFGRSSLEMAYGENIYTDQLGTSATSTLVNLGYRFMFTPRIGVQTIGQFDIIRSTTNDRELGYRAYSYSARAEAYYRVFNVGNVALAAHGGIGIMYVWYNTDQGDNIRSYTGGGSILYRLGLNRREWGALKLSYTYMYNQDQESTLNGLYSITEATSFQNITLGFLVYLDNRYRRQASDWIN